MKNWGIIVTRPFRAYANKFDDGRIRGESGVFSGSANRNLIWGTVD